MRRIVMGRTLSRRQREDVRAVFPKHASSTPEKYESGVYIQSTAEVRKSQELLKASRVFQMHVWQSNESGVSE